MQWGLETGVRSEVGFFQTFVGNNSQIGNMEYGQLGGEIYSAVQPRVIEGVVFLHKGVANVGKPFHIGKLLFQRPACPMRAERQRHAHHCVEAIAGQ